MELTPEIAVHRIGGAAIANLRLKPREARLTPPGISVLLGGTPAEVAAQARVAFERMPRLLAQTTTVGSSTAGAIRAAGFDVLPDPSWLLPNHARLIHPDGIAGFSDDNLARLSQAFEEMKGC